MCLTKLDRRYAFITYLITRYQFFYSLPQRNNEVFFHGYVRFNAIQGSKEVCFHFDVTAKYLTFALPQDHFQYGISVQLIAAPNKHSQGLYLHHLQTVNIYMVVKYKMLYSFLCLIQQSCIHIIKPLIPPLKLSPGQYYLNDSSNCYPPNHYIQLPRDMFFTIPVVVAILIAIVACIFILQPQTLSKSSMQDKIMRNQFRSSKHKWERSEQKSFYFCYLCGRLTNGWFSDILECKKCGIIIHKICRFMKLRKPDCKYIVAKNNASKFYHQWRQCSYIANSNCSVCAEICSGIESYICLWCNRMRHALCNGDGCECDFGPLRKFILEPTEIKCTSVNFTTNAFRTLKKFQKSIKDKTSGSQDNQSEDDSKITINCDPSKHIVVVLINKKSGGQIGNNFIKAFYRILNPLQVISILDEGLQKLKLFSEVPNIFLLIAGGDGTFCSVMNYIKTIPQWKDNNPPAAIIPLGTGNDLSRSLGWGGTIQEINAGEMVKEYFSLGKNEQLDRWKMTIKSQDHREFTIYNYIGIGLDAKICKDFHDMREKYPQLFFSQFSNKLIYTQIGTLDLIKNQNRTLLAQHFTMFVDEKEANIQDYENLILLNIEHWGGGVTQLWKADHKKGFEKESFSDGVVEIIGLTDVLHMGQVQVGMEVPFQVAQGKCIRLQSKTANKIIPFQIDGEPFEFITPFQIIIERKDQTNVLATTPTDNGKIINFLREARKESLISEEQYNQLIAFSKKEPVLQQK